MCDSCWDDIRLRTDERFLWTIGDEVDTTVSDTDCPYDRYQLSNSSFSQQLKVGNVVIGIG